MASAKKVDDRYIQHVARELKKLVDDRFEGNQTRAARALGMSQAHLSHLIAGQGGRGPGLNVLLRLREYTGRSIDALLGLPPVAEDELVERLRATLKTEVARIQRDARADRDRVEPKAPPSPRRKSTGS